MSHRVETVRSVSHGFVHKSVHIGSLAWGWWSWETKLALYGI